MDFFCRACRAFGDGTRLQILRLLSNKSYCVNALAERFDISQSAISQHLRVLREAGLVESEKEGYFVHYSISGEGLRRFAREAEELLEGAEGRDCPPHGAGGCGSTMHTTGE